MSGVRTFAMAPTMIPVVAAICRKCISIPAMASVKSAVRTSPDFLVVCGNFGKPDTTNIGTQSRWGNGNLKFCFLDASCPMDLVSLGNSWFPTFRGMHVATGHSGTSNADTLDSVGRGQMFAAYSSGAFFFFPYMSVGSAWMATGTIDIQSGCSAASSRPGAIATRQSIVARTSTSTTTVPTPSQTGSPGDGSPDS